MSTIARLLSLSTLAVLLTGGCMCGSSRTTGKTCVTDEDCSSDGSRFCKPSLPEADGAGCVNATRTCSNEGECCPGQICSQTAGVCFDKAVPCVDDRSCADTVRGQVCRPIGSPKGDKGCTFEACGEGGTCRDGTSCFNGFCVGEAPCNGGCPSGSVCTTANNRCFTIDDPTNPYPASCSQTCGSGTMLVFADGSNVFNRCDRRQRECVCAPLPKVSSSDLARHSSAGVTSDRILVSAYDADHGDLVVHTFDKSATPKLLKTEWVDGVPTTGEILGDPNGPRQGRTAPGIDVGEYSSLAFDAANDVTHVAYYARQAINKAPTPPTALGNLRYAVKVGSSAWVSHTVDGQTNDADAATDTGDVGAYASLTLTRDGFPVVAYFQKGGVGGARFQTALKIARATKRVPTKADDWVVTTIDTGTATKPPCSDTACTADQVCTEGGSNGTCLAKAPRTQPCAPTCGSDQACVATAPGVSECKKSLRASTLAGLPEGNGLFPSIAFTTDNRLVAVWYDQKERVLKGTLGNDSVGTGVVVDGTVGIRVLDAGVRSGGPVHDVGQFPSVSISPTGRVGVAYFDATARQLLLLVAPRLTDLASATPLVVDDGTNTGADPLLFVGADASLKFDGGDNAHIAYQDSTGNDLRIASQSAGGDFVKRTLANTGAGGFWASLVVDASGKYVSHAVVKARSGAESANKLQVLKVP